MNSPVTRIRLRRRSRSLAAIGFATLLMLLFLLLGFTLQEPYAQALDQAAGKALLGYTSEPLHAAARFFDFLGSTSGFALLTVLIAGALLILRRAKDALFVVAATAGAFGLNTAAKHLFSRPRPVLEALFAADGFSYPSGNATISAALLGMAAILFAQQARSGLARGIVVVLAVSLLLGLGLFHIYAGVHYPTDIIGGYLLGVSYLIVLNGLRGNGRNSAL
jgi:undecaprenyl-diphosphatase